MRILFFTSNCEDYLSDGLLIGLRGLLGCDLVDFPKAEILYANCDSAQKKQVRGNGFTLYSGLLEDLPIDRFKVRKKIEKGYYDLVVFSDIWRQFGYFLESRPWLEPKKTAIVDGADSPQVYPYAGLWWRRPYSWLLPRAERDFLYFKREWTCDSQFNLYHRLVPGLFRSMLPTFRGLRKIGFSIPDEKIVDEVPSKTKDFASHCVDPEAAARLVDCREGYVFTKESDYYADLQASRYGITTRRAGWDCLRHYEIAANGTVPCFRNLNDKPETCAPHGLNVENSVAYGSADELLRRLEDIDEGKALRLALEAIKWAQTNSCTNVAKRFLGEFAHLKVEEK